MSLFLAVFISQMLTAQITHFRIEPPIALRFVNFPAPSSDDSIRLEKYSKSPFSGTMPADSVIQANPSPHDSQATTILTRTEKVSQVEVEMPFFQDSTCIDLCFDTLIVRDISDKYVEIEFSIVNKGTAPAPLFGKRRSNEDNVAIHFYYSGTPRLTRGSILAEGIYLTEGLRETKGLLAPQAVYRQKFRLPLEKKNRFYGVIILQLDAFDILRHECDETNNVKAVIPKWY
jgi:hypothetical protein